VVAVLHLHLVAAALALPLSGVAHNAKGSIAAPDAVVVFCHRPCNHQKLFFSFNGGFQRDLKNQA